MKAVKMRVTDTCSAQDIKKHLESLGYSWQSIPPFPFHKPHFSGRVFSGERDPNFILYYENEEQFLNDDTCEEIFLPSEECVQVSDKAPAVDMVNNPSHYTSHKSGIECIEITRFMGFNLGNALKYIWRCDLKKDAIEDLRKAIFYLNDEIELRLKQKVEFKNVEVL